MSAGAALDVAGLVVALDPRAVRDPEAFEAAVLDGIGRHDLAIDVEPEPQRFEVGVVRID